MTLTTGQILREAITVAIQVIFELIRKQEKEKQKST